MLHLPCACSLLALLGLCPFVPSCTHTHGPPVPPCKDHLLPETLPLLPRRVPSPQRPLHTSSECLLSRILSFMGTINWFHLRLVPIDWRWLPGLIRRMRLFGSAGGGDKRTAAVGMGAGSPCWHFFCPTLVCSHWTLLESGVCLSSPYDTPHRPVSNVWVQNWPKGIFRLFSVTVRGQCPDTRLFLMPPSSRPSNIPMWLDQALGGVGGAQNQPCSQIQAGKKS